MACTNGSRRRASAAARAACDSSALTLSPARGVAVLRPRCAVRTDCDSKRFRRHFLRDRSSDTSFNSACDRTNATRRRIAKLEAAKALPAAAEQEATALVPEAKVPPTWSRWRGIMGFRTNPVVGWDFDYLRKCPSRWEGRVGARGGWGGGRWARECVRCNLSHLVSRQI